VACQVITFYYRHKSVDKGERNFVIEIFMKLPSAILDFFHVYMWRGLVKVIKVFLQNLFTENPKPNN